MTTMRLSTSVEESEKFHIHENSGESFWKTTIGKITATALLILATIPLVTAPATIYFICKIWTDCDNEGIPASDYARPQDSLLSSQQTHHDTTRIDTTKRFSEVKELREEVLHIISESGNPRGRQIPAMPDNDMSIDDLKSLRGDLSHLKSRITRDQARHKLFTEVNELHQGILELDNPKNRIVPQVIDGMSTRRLGTLRSQLTNLRQLIIEDRAGLVNEVGGLRNGILSIISQSGNPKGRAIPAMTHSMNVEELVVLRGELTRLREVIIQDQGFEQLKGMLSQSRGDLEEARPEFIQMSTAALKEFEGQSSERKQELSQQIESLQGEWHQLSEKEKRLQTFQSGAQDALEKMREKVQSLEVEKKDLTQQYEEISEARDLREIAAKKLGLRKKTSKETLKEKRETVEQHQSALRDQRESHWTYMQSIPTEIREVRIAKSKINQQLDPLRAELFQIDRQRYEQGRSNKENSRKFDAFIARVNELESEVLRVESLSFTERSDQLSKAQGIDIRVKGFLNVEVSDFLRDLKWLATQHISRF